MFLSPYVIYRGNSVLLHYKVSDDCIRNCITSNISKKLRSLNANTMGLNQMTNVFVICIITKYT